VKTSGKNTKSGPDQRIVVTKEPKVVLIKVVLTKVVLTIVELKKALFIKVSLTKVVIMYLPTFAMGRSFFY